MSVQAPVKASNPEQMAMLERVVVQGDLGALTDAQRLEYYGKVCESVGLNPLTQPFEYMRLNGKLRLYPTRNASDQLRKLHGISVFKIERELDDQTMIYTITAYGRDASQREDSATGSVPIAGLKGENLANAYMKAETKAKRRLTLSMAGLGWLDETEVASIRAPHVTVDPSSGAIVAEEQPQLESNGDSDPTDSNEALSGEALSKAQAAVEDEAVKHELFWPDITAYAQAEFGKATPELTRAEWTSLYKATKAGKVKAS